MSINGNFHPFLGIQKKLNSKSKVFKFFLPSCRNYWNFDKVYQRTKGAKIKDLDCEDSQIVSDY